MQVLNVIQTILLYYCVIMIVVKIYEYKFSNKSIYFSLIYLPIIYVAIKADYNTFMALYPSTAIINIILIKLTYSKMKITSLIYLHLLLFMATTTVASAIIIFTPQSDYPVEMAVYLLMLISNGLICFTKLKSKVKLIHIWTPKFIKVTILALLILTSLVSTLIFDIFKYSSNPAWLLVIQVFTILLVVGVCVLLPIIVNKSVNNQYLKRLTDNYKKQIENQANHYSALAKSNWEIRRFRHDFKNLWIGLNELIAKGEPQEALNMLNKCHSSFVNSTDSILTFDTGNGIVDALLSDKQEVAKTHNAVLQFSGAVPSQGIAPTDLCVLFGNTLDNALEACEKLPAKSPKAINIVCKRTGNYLFIYIRNPVIENVEIKNNTIPTTKEDKSAHGFGLYSLEQVVRKHDGELKLTCNDHLFETAIDLCLDI